MCRYAALLAVAALMSPETDSPSPHFEQPHPCAHVVDGFLEAQGIRDPTDLAQARKWFPYVEVLPELFKPLNVDVFRVRSAAEHPHSTLFLLSSGNTCHVVSGPEKFLGIDEQANMAVLGEVFVDRFNRGLGSHGSITGSHSEWIETYAKAVTRIVDPMLVLSRCRDSTIIEDQQQLDALISAGRLLSAEERLSLNEIQSAKLERTDLGVEVTFWMWNCFGGYIQRHIVTIDTKAQVDVESEIIASRVGAYRKGGIVDDTGL